VDEEQYWRIIFLYFLVLEKVMLNRGKNFVYYPEFRSKSTILKNWGKFFPLFQRQARFSPK